MDVTGVTEITSLLNSGGDAATLFAVWVAYKAMQSAREAVTAIKEMRDALVRLEPTALKILDTTNRLEADASDIKQVAKENAILLVALARKQGI